MKHFLAGPEFLSNLYSAENAVSGLFARFDYAFAPILIAGQVADLGVYHIPATAPSHTDTVTYPI